MRSITAFRFALFLGFSSLAFAQGSAYADSGLRPVPAEHSPMATHVAILGSARAGTRLVAVGDHGVILLSDDDGQHVRQAHSVPVDATLTEVSFVDAQRGWAVGHWGVILATTDGGENWQIQRVNTEEDRPIFSVHFDDAQHGIAVGLWSLVLATNDGGKTWTTRQLAPPPGGKKADLNLLHIFSSPGGALYVAAERGMMLKSTDHGANWAYNATGCKGSFWTGLAITDDLIVAAGQRGEIYRSADAGAHWEHVDLASKSSVTGLAARGTEIVAVGLDGLVATSHDSGATFKVETRADKLSLTSISQASSDRWAIWSRSGLADSTAVR